MGIHVWLVVWAPQCTELNRKTTFINIWSITPSLSGLTQNKSDNGITFPKNSHISISNNFQSSQVWLCHCWFSFFFLLFIFQNFFLSPSFMSSLLCFAANSCMLFLIFLFKSTILFPTGSLTICHLRETRGKQSLNPGFKGCLPS